jgi:prolyl oligopeptidase
MLKKFLFPVLFLFTAFQCTPKKDLPPLAPVNVVTEVYFGKSVDDPYRYMENLKDSTVAEWMKTQGKYARNYLDLIPGRQSLIDKMMEFDKRTSILVTSLNITGNDLYFYLKTLPGEETGKLFYREGFKGAEALLFDPASMKHDSLSYVISEFAPSPDGSMVGIEVAANGSESSLLRIIDVKTKTFAPETIDRCWGSGISWIEGQKSFLYNRLNSTDVHNMERELNSKAFLHKVGTDASQDQLILSAKNNPSMNIKPEEVPVVFAEPGTDYLYAIISTVDNRLNFWMAPLSDLNKSKIQWKQVFKMEDEVVDFGVTTSDLYFRTFKDAPNFKIMKTSLAKPDVKTAELLVAESKESNISQFALNLDGLYYVLSTNGVLNNLYFIPNNAKEASEVKLPVVAGSVYLSTKDFRYNDLWVSLTGWSADGMRYRYTKETGEFVKEKLSTIPEYPEYQNLAVEEVMVESHDGVKVPLSIIYNKDSKLDGSMPAFIFGYGAYGMPMSPGFSPNMLLWVNKGGVLAVAHVRGGGELGDAWHKGGFKTTKPNTWKDLIACTEYIINNKYSSKGKIAIYSGSAGGILIGRAMTERPDLFAACIPEVGCMNAIRMENTPNGPINAAEFGTQKDSAECMALIEMDSYLHVQDGVKYPATLITAGMNDPRVIAWQPGKFAARIQAANASENPMLFLVDYESGHGMGDMKTKSFEKLADAFSFAFMFTGHPDFQK